MNMLYNNSINTIRIVTINKNNKVSVLGTVVRIGTHISRNVDNWAAGGCLVRISEKGVLNKYGYFKPKFGNLLTKHPDTNVTFENYKIVDYDKVVKLVI